MDADLSDLYQSIILDHHKHPRNAKALEGPTGHAHGSNPLCGDELDVWVKLEGDTLVEIGCTGQGCAISQASGSLMTLAVKGKTALQAHTLVSVICQLLADPSQPSLDAEQFGDLVALEGVRQFPARVKCATLGWHTLEAALNHKEATFTEL